FGKWPGATVKVAARNACPATCPPKMSRRPESGGVHARHVSASVASTWRMSASFTASGAYLATRTRSGAGQVSGARRTVGGPPPPRSGGVQNHLAQPNRGGVHLDAFVLTNELQSLFQGKLQRRDQPHRLIRGCGAHVGELLLLGGVDIHVFRAGVFA